MKSILTVKQAREYVDFLEENKDLVGLSDWTMIVNTRPLEDESEGTIARAITNSLEKEMTVYLTKEFLKLESKRQKNVLIHELIHGRICIFEGIVKEVKDREEEHLVNDLTRGLERLNDF